MTRDDRRCQFVIGGARFRGDPAVYCEAPTKPRRSYCEAHHGHCLRETYEADRYNGERPDFEW